MGRRGKSRKKGVQLHQFATGVITITGTIGQREAKGRKCHRPNENKKARCGEKSRGEEKSTFLGGRNGQGVSVTVHRHTVSYDNNF